MLRTGPILLSLQSLQIFPSSRKRALPQLQKAAFKPKQCQNVSVAKGDIWMNHFHIGAGNCPREGWEQSESDCKELLCALPAGRPEGQPVGHTG